MFYLKLKIRLYAKTKMVKRYKYMHNNNNIIIMNVEYVMAASYPDFVIGNELLNSLPWYLPEDLRHFKELTLGHVVIMGRKTFDSIGKALAGRTNIVLTSQVNLTPVTGVHYFSSIDAIFNFVQTLGGKKKRVFVIGGAQVYNLFLPMCSVIHFTAVYTQLHTINTLVYSDILTNEEKQIVASAVPKKSLTGLDYKFFVFNRKYD